MKSITGRVTANLANKARSLKRLLENAIAVHDAPCPCCALCGTALMLYMYQSVPCSTRIPMPLMYQYALRVNFHQHKNANHGQPGFARTAVWRTDTCSRRCDHDALFKSWSSHLCSQFVRGRLGDGLANCEVGKDDQTFKNCDNALVFHATGLYDLIIQLQKHKHVSTVYLTIDQGVQFHNFKSSFSGFPDKWRCPIKQNQ